MKSVLLVLAALLLALVGVVVVAGARWRSRTAGLVGRLQAASAGVAPAVYSSRELDGLPAPVARYFRTVLRDGQPIPRRARIEQHGTFAVKATPDGWRPFTAVQQFTAHPAGFVWDARIRMAPGLDFLVRDAFVNGRGSMYGTILGLIPVVDVHDTPDIAAGALVRFLAEAVWLPTALLPSQGVRWAPIDSTSARATLTSGGTTVSLDFHFGADGLVERIYAPARGRDVAGTSVPTPWEGRWLAYAERGGVLVPVRGEVAWILPAGPLPYWRGEIGAVAYD
ncbi:MAG TPA: DUF6544 family protein [Gemmatimonadales bacterium]|nr:DUF6544 family protein [Gemmatimonadales bacterium]